MHVFQYEFTLPADYDMGIIHHRIATRSHATDAFPGLALKAYLTRERGTDGSPVNEYAPFYLWRGTPGMNAFLWGPGFRTLCADFGRPSIRNWTGLGFFAGPASDAIPHTASRLTTTVPEDVDAAAVIEESLTELRDSSRSPGVHSAALAVDTRRWELVRFLLWTRDADKNAGTRYQVGHLSTPELPELTSGRLW